MTVVNVRLQAGPGVAVSAEQSGQATRPVVRDSGLLLPAPKATVIAAGVGSIDVPASPAGPQPAWCWKVTTRLRGPESDETFVEHVIVPDAGPVDFEDLVRVDPLPDVPPYAALQSLVAQAQAAADAARDAAAFYTGGSLIQSGTTPYYGSALAVSFPEPFGGVPDVVPVFTTNSTGAPQPAAACIYNRSETGFGVLLNPSSPSGPSERYISWIAIGPPAT